MVHDFSERFPQDRLRIALLQITHFSSPVMIRLKNGSFSLRLNNESQMEMQSIKVFFQTNHVVPRHQDDSRIPAYVNAR